MAVRTGTPRLLQHASRTHMLAVTCAATGVSRREIAKRLGCSHNAVHLWESWGIQKWVHEESFREMYMSAPNRDIVESLGLHRPENLGLAVSFLKRKLDASSRQLGEILGLSGTTVARTMSDSRRVNAKSAAKIAVLCREVGVSLSDLEGESRQPRPFIKENVGQVKNFQILFSDRDPQMEVKDILRQAKKDTGVEFQAMSAAIGTTRGNFCHYVAGRLTVNAERQRQLHIFLAAAYGKAGLRSPLRLQERAT